jgi:hypothetical protein
MKEERPIINRIPCPEAENPYCVIDNIKASPNGQFIAVGFPSTNKREGKVIFMKVNLAESTAEPIKPEIKVSFKCLFLNFLCSLISTTSRATTA